MPRPLDPEVVAEIFAALAEAPPANVGYYSIEELVEGSMRYAIRIAEGAISHSRTPEAVKARVRQAAEQLLLAAPPGIVQ
jgi:hypothetical protein